MGLHAGNPSDKRGRYRGLHSDKPVLEEGYGDLYADTEHRVRLRAPKAVALAAVGMALTASMVWLAPNQTVNHRKVLSAPTRGPQRASVQPTESRTGTPLADPSEGSQPVPTATVTLPGTRQTVRVSTPAMRPEAVSSPLPGPVATQTAYRPVPGPTVTVTKSIPSPGPTVTAYARRSARPRVTVTITISIPALP